MSEQRTVKFPDFVVLPEHPHPPHHPFCSDCGARLVFLRQEQFAMSTGEPLYAWRCPNYRWWRHLLLSRCWMSDIATEGGYHVMYRGLW